MDKDIFGFDNLNNGFIDILKSHHQIDDLLLASGSSIFISDWQCNNPFAAAYTPKNSDLDSLSEDYTFYSDDFELIALIEKMHSDYQEKEYTKNNILPGDGSSTFIASFCTWLFKNNIKEVYYIPPMYYTFYYFLELFKIRARPISGKQAYEDDFSCNLPDSKSILILCDPIWYVGQSVKKDIIDKIIFWQQKTKSIVFVDGSFQYTKWSGEKYEYSSQLDQSLTFRLICPTKFLAVHGYRFSYLLLPEAYREEILYIYSSSIGSTTKSNTIFAKHAIRTMIGRTKNILLLNHISNIFTKLHNSNVIETAILPECGFFIFAKTTKPLQGYIALNETHFEQKKYKEYVRINLLKENIIEILS